MIKLEAHKIEIDMAGNEHELPMNDLLEVGLYEKNNGSDKPIYLQLHRIRSGEQTVNVTTLKRPDSGGIDPNYLMIDLRLDDNIMQLPL